MISLGTITTPERPCSYLPDRSARMEYQLVAELSPAEYAHLMLAGWRRFGRSLFRPTCLGCSECKPLRIDVTKFRPNQSQKRCWKANKDEVRLEIRTPEATPEKLALYDRYHTAQVEAKGWQDRGPEEVEAYIDSFVDQPFPVEEWCYFLGDELVGVGYVDDVPSGLSAIYFFHDPAYRDRGLGTFNVLSILDRAAKRGRDHVHLGYYVAGSGSLAYKANFRPNEIRTEDGDWVPLREE